MVRVLGVVLGCVIALSTGSATGEEWTACGWGGGGFYYAAAYHPTRDGVLYMGGDVNGVYKSEDHGQHWRIINNGLADYGVFTLAVDRANPETVYAATEGGLCKSTDGGEHWRLLPRTGRKDLRITGEKGKSIRAVAVAPGDGQVVYAGSPAGKVYKSVNGGETWQIAYEKQAASEDLEALRVQYGKVNGEWYGGIWLPLEFPKGTTSADCTGFGFSFRGDGQPPRDALVTLKTKSGVPYRSKNVRELFQDTQWRDVVLTAADFSVDPEYVKKQPADAKAPPAAPDWSTIERVDVCCVGPLMNDASVGKFGRFFFALSKAADAPGASVEKPVLKTVREFAKDKSVAVYGNARCGSASEGSVFSVAVAASNPALVLAATETSGVVLSTDGGRTWRETSSPKKAASVTVAPTNADIFYGAFFADGVWKSTDGGRTWKALSQGMGKNYSAVEVAVSPANLDDVYVISKDNWNGRFHASHDGGVTWRESSRLRTAADIDPTLPQECAKDKTLGLSTPTNLTISPRNPKELFISANWRPCTSDDAGSTWSESARGADISCITDIRFHGGRVYVTAMDEGALVSPDNGRNWQPLWPLKYSDQLSGHCWRIAVDEIQGATRILTTASPWNTAFPNGVILSEDDGKTYRRISEGLPNYVPTANTMWGQGYARALAVDPKDPRTMYLGIDGDAEGGKSGGGVFKSTDGGHAWKQLAQQPASHRMFFGLAVDPTDPQRLYWAGCGGNGGLFRSEDGGASWQRVFTGETWIFNVAVGADGTVYCPGKNLWRSTDHGKTWKQLTRLSGDAVIVGLAVDPGDPQRIWFSRTTWGGDATGGVFSTRDGGATWQEITGNLPYRKPMVLRFNPATQELWAGGVGLYRIGQPTGR